MVGLVTFYGPGVPGGRDGSPTSVTIEPADSGKDIRDKLVDAIVADAARLGYDVVANRVIVPSYDRGK